MKKILKVLPALIAVMMVLYGCIPSMNNEPDASGSAAPVASPTPEATATPDNQADTFDILITNSASVGMSELCISPSGDTSWGDNLLGGSPLASGGEFSASLLKYDFETYDVLIVDEDLFSFRFDRVTFTDGAEAEISFDGDGNMMLYVELASGESQGYIGEEVDSSGGGSVGGEETGYDTQGKMSFTIYNESDYDIYSVFMGPANPSGDEDVDILPVVLEAHTSYEFETTVDAEYWNIVEWTLYIVDVDDDVSESYDVFNPWSLSYVDVTWNGSAYVCSFEYR